MFNISSRKLPPIMTVLLSHFVLILPVSSSGRDLPPSLPGAITVVLNDTSTVLGRVRFQISSTPGSGSAAERSVVEDEVCSVVTNSGGHCPQTPRIHVYAALFQCVHVPRLASPRYPN